MWRTRQNPFPARHSFALIETARGLAAVREISAVFGVTGWRSVRLILRGHWCGVWARCAVGGSLCDRACLTAQRVGAAARRSNYSIDDSELIEEDARYAYRLGFGGKLCVHSPPDHAGAAWFCIIRRGNCLGKADTRGRRRRGNCRGRNDGRFAGSRTGQTKFWRSMRQ